MLPVDVTDWRSRSAASARARAGPRAGLQGAQPLGHEHPVFAVERHNVARRGEGQEVEVVEGTVRVVVAVGKGGLHELKAQPAPRELREGIIVVRPLGIEHGQRLRQGFLGRVMVGNDEVEPLLLRVGRLRMARDAAVERNHEAGALLRRAVEPAAAQPIAVLVAVRDKKRRLHAMRAQEVRDQRRRRRPVHVVVPVDQHALAVLDGRRHPGRRRGHVAHPQRVVQRRAIGPKEVLRLLKRGNLSQSQGAGQRRRQIVEGLLQPRHHVRSLQ
jgi:hypothetical protein